MTIDPLLFAAAPFLAVAIAGLWLLQRRRLRASVLAGQLGKLLRAGNRRLAVKLCRAAPEATGCQVGLFLLGLKLPRHVAGDGRGGYRTDAGGPPFEDRLRAALEVEARRLRGRHRQGAMIVVAGGVGSLLFAGAAALGGSGEPAWIVAGVTLVVVVQALRFRHELDRAIDIVAGALLPLLVPEEELPVDADADGAAEAYGRSMEGRGGDGRGAP